MNSWALMVALPGDRSWSELGLMTTFNAIIVYYYTTVKVCTLVHVVQESDFKLDLTMEATKKWLKQKVSR